MSQTRIEKPTIGITTKLSYGSGQAVDAVIQGAINTFLLFYLTTVCGMSGGLAGSIFLFSLVIDALVDPAIGRLSDTTQSRFGRRLPFMAFAMFPMIGSAFLIFNLPEGVGPTMLYATALGLNIILRIGLSLFALPHSALLAEFTNDYSERAVIGTYRALFIVVGTAAVLLPGFGYIFADSSALESRHAYSTFGGLTAALVAVFGLTCLFGIFKPARRLPTPSNENQQGRSGLIKDVMQLFKNRSFVLMFVGAVLVLVGQGATTTLNLHAFRFFWVLPAAYMQLPLLMLPMGMIVGTGIAAVVLKRIEKRDGVIGAVFVLGFYQIAATLMISTGVVAPGSAASIALVAGNGFLFGAGGAMCFICFYAMIADAVDEHELLFDIRREALFAAALMIGSKAATGIGAFIAGTGLQLIGFSDPADALHNPKISASVASDLGLLWGVAPALIVLAAIPFLRFYTIDRARHLKIIGALKTRRRDSLTGVVIQ
jgi:glycoside/pentoside/hexuronide:cation symporter, GPH family